jgi:hypothetical protein
VKDPTTLAPVGAPLGIIFTAGVGEEIPSGTAVRTRDGGWLGFERPTDDLDSDSRFMVSVECVGAILQSDQESDEDSLVLTLTTALTDRDGRMWQRSCVVGQHDLWEHMGTSLRPFHRLWESDPYFGNAVDVRRRALAVDIHTLNDGRDTKPISVHRLPEGGRVGDYGEVYHFLLHLKYFGAEFDLYEEIVTYRPPAAAAPGAARRPIPQLKLVFRPTVHVESLPDAAHPKIDLLDLSRVPNGGLVAEHFRLPTGWLGPAWEPVVEADKGAWMAALTDAGGDADTHRAFRPNPHVRWFSASTPDESETT